jgi:hypothetical protein
MFLSLSKYKKYIIIAMVMLVAIPCSTKRELKQWFPIQHQPNQGENKISCSNYIEINQVLKKERTQKHIIPFRFSSTSTKHSVLTDKKTSLSDFFGQQKEKIPTYILYEKFLI